MSNLPAHIRKDIEEFIEENNFIKCPLEEFSTYDLIDHWLTWNGIIGYTGQIIDMIDAIRVFKGEK